MIIFAWFVIVVNSLITLLNIKGLFVGKEISNRVASFISAIVSSITIYLLVYGIVLG